MKKRALIVVDVQNDFCNGGALAVPLAHEIIPTINRLMLKYPLVVLTQDYHPAGHLSFASSHPGKKPLDVVDMPYGKQVLWPDHCLQDWAGSAFHRNLRSERGHVIFRKGTRKEADSYSAFIEADGKTTGLDVYLRGLGYNELHFVGLATDFCVAWSALDAVKLGFNVSVLLDACRGINANGSMQKAVDNMQEGCVLMTTSMKYFS